MIKELNICDNCGKESHWGNPITMSCGYGSIFDEEVLHFCSDDCCATFIKRKQEECKSGKGYCLEIREAYEKQREQFFAKLQKSVEEKKK